MPTAEKHIGQAPWRQGACKCIFNGVMTERQPRTIYDVLGSNLKEWRIARGWSQDELAHRAREWGLRWYRSSVEATETGKKPLDVADLALLLLATDCGIQELLHGKGEVKVKPQVYLELRHVQRMLRGNVPLPDDTTSPDDLPWMNRRHDPNQLRLFPTEVGMPERQLASGEAEQKVARTFTRKFPRRVSADEVLNLAVATWGTSLTEERENRLRQRETHLLPNRTLQALRGRITRQLLTELEPKILEHLKETGRG